MSPRFVPAMRHVLLDLDGTLTDPAPGIVASLQHVATSLGLPTPTEAHAKGLIGPPLREGIGRLLGTEDSEAVSRGVALYREYFATQGMFQNAVIDGVFEALDILRTRGFTMHLVTSKALPFAKQITAHFGLADHLAGQFGADMSGGRSDKASLIRWALEDLGLSPHEAVMVGDRKHDLAGAKACSIACIGVLWGYGSLQELAAEKPDRIVIDIADLADVISELSRSRDPAPP